MKYPEKQFELYDKNCFSTTSWQEIFSGRRVLICSIVRPPLCFIQNYIIDLQIYREMYKLLGVDEVYLLSRSRLGLVSLLNRTTIPCMADVNSEFALHLNSLVNTKEYSKNHLSSFWAYQVLINDGEVEQITQQPLENYLATMLKDTKNIAALKAIGLKNEKLIWTPTFLTRTIKLARDIFYYRLHPNIELKKHLFSTYPNSVDNKDK